MPPFVWLEEDENGMQIVKGPFNELYTTFMKRVQLK